jgi:carboxymethylenebutenolidase
MSQITLSNQDGKSFNAYFAAAASENAPGIVLIQEIFGINASMRKAADQWASLGYNVVCPDLFWRQEPGIQLDPAVPAQFSRGVEFMQGMDYDAAVSDLEVARRWLAERIGHDRIAGLGYCMGGRLVVSLAAKADIKCAVSYYGVGLDELVPATPDNAAPTLLHIAALDAYVPKEALAKITDAVHKKNGWEMHVYEGCDHAFARPDGEHRNEAATQLAQERSVSFMQKHLV